MGKELKSTKKYKKKGGLKRELARRPALKKAHELRTHKLNKAVEYDSKDKSQKALEADFKKQLEALVKQKKQLPGEDEVDFSDFLKSGLDGDDDFDISSDEEGDLEFGAEGQVKGKKGKKAQKKSAQMDEDEEEDDEGGDFEGEEDDEGGEFEGEEDDEGGEFEEREDDGDTSMNTDAMDEEEEGDDEEGDAGEGEDDFESKLSKKDKKRLHTQENLERLLDEENLDLDDEIEAHRQELRSLKELDPSFFDYLAQEGTDVLDFDKMSKDMKEKKQTESGGIITVTSKMLQGWITKAIEDDSIEDIKKILTAFQVSVMSEEEAIENQMPFRIERESVFNELVVFCLEQMPDIFYELMEDPGKAAKPAKPSDIPTAKNVSLHSLPGFSKIKNLVLIFANVIFRLMEEASDDQMLTFIISNIVQFIPFVATSPGHTKQFLRTLMHIWASASKEARTAAYICLRQLTLYVPFPFINSVLRGLYLVFMQNCKSMNSAVAMELITFMRGCVVEMYGMDFECSYQHMFNYLRQLAVTLQKGLVAPASGSVGQVYSWQYMNALRLWTDVLCKYPKQQHLQHLLYPLIQVIQGSITLDAQPRYYPYRIHLIRMLNDLASSNTQTFINSAPFSLDILSSPLMQTTYPFGGKNAYVDFKVMRKVSENLTRTRQFQDELINQITELLATNLATYAYSVSFPELATFPIKLLTSFLEQRGESASTSYLAQLRTSLEQSATHIRKLRDKTDKAPKEITNGLTTFFSTNLKNTDKSPLVAFLARYNKQVAKWEAILSEKRVKLEKFTNYESDEEKGGSDESDNEDEETTKQNGTTTTATKAEQNKEKTNKRKKREQAKKAKAQKAKEEKPKEENEGEKKNEKQAKLGKFKGDVTGQLTLSDDDEEQPKQKKAKVDKTKQNGATQHTTPKAQSNKKEQKVKNATPKKQKK